MSSTIHGQSHQAIKHFRDNPAALAIYWIYCSRVNPDNVAWPSLASLMRDTGWSRTYVNKARKWLVDHGALIEMKKYIKPEWRHLEGAELRKKQGMDRTKYYRPTAYLEIDGQKYAMLYNPQAEPSDSESYENIPESTHTTRSTELHSVESVPELSTSSTERDTKKDISPQNGDSAPEEKAVTSTKKERPPNVWYDVIAETMGAQGYTNGQIEWVLRATGKNGYAKYDLTTPLTDPEQVRVFWRWYQSTCEGCSLSSPKTVQDYVMRWQAAGMPDPAGKKQQAIDMNEDIEFISPAEMIGLHS